MPLDPIIARGVEAPNPTNALIASEELLNRRNYNALLRAREDYSRQRDAASDTKEQQQQEMLALLPYVEAGDTRAVQTVIGRIAERSPQMAQVFAADPSRLAPAMRNLLGLDAPQAVSGPPQRSTERVGGFEVLLEDGRRVGQRVMPVLSQSASARPSGTAAAASRQATVAQSYSPKEVSTARAKLTQIKVAKQQLANARQKLAEAPRSEVGGPVAGALSTIGIFQGGQAAQAAVDGMRGSITAITRTPGVGAMSDYETRLDQSKFPNFWTDRETTMEQKLQQLDDLLSTMEAGYSEILGPTAGSPSVRRRYNPEKRILE